MLKISDGLAHSSLYETYAVVKATQPLPCMLTLRSARLNQTSREVARAPAPDFVRPHSDNRQYLTVDRNVEAVVSSLAVQATTVSAHGTLACGTDSPNPAHARQGMYALCAHSNLWMIGCRTSAALAEPFHLQPSHANCVTLNVRARPHPILMSLGANVRTHCPQHRRWGSGRIALVGESNWNNGL